MPRFDPETVELFFEMFKEIAVQRDWPKVEWVALMQGSLTGKAPEAYAALDLSQSHDYDTVRQALLKAYELVSEAYRQRFRTERIQKQLLKTTGLECFPS